MAKRITFAARAWSGAPAPVIYALLADGSTWPAWSPIGSFELAREGESGGETTGAVRVFKTGTVRTREELVELRPDEQLSYTAFAGLPLRDHRADVVLSARDGGTAIEWRESFEPKYPGTGWLLHRFLARFVQRCADGLARRAEQDANRAGAEHDDQMT